MMYAKGKIFTKDFIIRTKYNINHLNTPYEVTQLINSMVGLLIIPEQKYFKQITDDMICGSLLNEIRGAIEKNTYDSKNTEISLQDITLHLRNGVAHFRMSFEENSNGEIANVIIKDHRSLGSKKAAADFEIKLSVDLLKRYLFEFSEAFCNILT